jgi:chromosome segregation ATPase
MVTIEQELEAANAQVAELTEKLAAAQVQARTNYADFQAAVENRDAAKAEAKQLSEQLATVNAEKAELASKVEQFDATLNEKAQELAQRANAAAGVPPVSLPVADELPQKESKKDFAHLKGLEKAMAIHKAEQANK